MAVIDSDAHVIEPDQIWDYMDPSEQQYRPLQLIQARGEGEQQEYILTQAKLHKAKAGGINLFGSGEGGDKRGTPVESRFLLDVEARLRHMDEIGTDIQVIYPTLFIDPIATKPEAEMAMCRAYNRWMAEVSARAGGRLPWVCVVPFRDRDGTIAAMNYSKEHGACGVFMHPVEFDNLLVSNPYFYPMYQEASRLDMPVTFHAGNASMDFHRFWAEDGASRNRFTGLGAFNLIVENDVPGRFPDLRIGFIEFGAQWLPYLVSYLQRRLSRRGKPVVASMLRDNRIWVTCETHDDIPYLVACVGEDNLLAGTDYGHADTSTELMALQEFRRRTDIDARVVNKILDDNARAFYAL